MKAKSGKVNVGMIVMIALAVAGLAFGYVQFQKGERRRAEEARLAREREAQERERTEAERRAEQERLEREEQARLLEQRRQEAAREAEREAARRKAEAEEAENRRKLAELAAIREAYAPLRDGFSGKVVRIWDDAASEDRPSVAKSRCVFAFDTYAEDRKLYLAAPGADGKPTIVVMDGAHPAEKVDVPEFSKRCKGSRFAVLVEGSVWLRGLAANGADYSIPKEGAFVAAEAELGGLANTLADLGAAYPAVRCRLSLRHRNGKRSLPVAVTGYADAVELEKLDAVLAQELTARRKGSAGRGQGGSPKLKKFKPTVVFYDGELIKKEMGGLTRVPRRFVFKGTSTWKGYNRRTVDDARRKWEVLRDEAERQESQAAEVELENRRLMEEYEAAQRSRVLKAEATEDDVLSERANWRIRVERTRPRKE